LKSIGLTGTGASATALVGAVGVYLESSATIAVAMSMALLGIVSWLRASAPHDHWRGMRRRNPGDP
jgi:hypothetical protein